MTITTPPSRPSRARRWAPAVSLALALLGAAGLPGCERDPGAAAESQSGAAPDNAGGSSGVAAESAATAAEPAARADADAPGLGEAQPASAPRIAALLPFAADQLLAIGVTPVAVPGLLGPAPESWAGIPTIALDHSAGPNLEQLLAADPDLIITSAVYAQFVPAMERSTGARVVVMDVESVDSVTQHIELLGELSGRTEAASALSARVGGPIPGPLPDPPVSTLAIFGTPHAFYAFLPESYLGDLISRAGGKLITQDMQSHPVFRGLAPLSMEAVVARDPELLIIVFHGPEATARAMVERDPLWGSLRAVRQGNAVFLHDDLYAMRPGSELLRAKAEIAQIIAGVRGGER